ncbi:M20 family metallopeptidase [Ammoniphilus sp. YIM 78166]|uniref:M20 family metallopeptidase n=1 Tax=Ammoniphilus sp. YIM 78166 TaxID=1644106 RepID=UPI00106F5714|nr:M20 family metallopeptidase [Ammoniphilus sp. YIM 78166]
MLNSIKQRLIEQEVLSIELLQKFTEIESFSYDKEGIDRLSAELIQTFSHFPLLVDIFKEETYGNHVRFTWGKGNRQITVLSHLDTVYPRGTLSSMPFKVEGERIFGPGVYDMKFSYVMMYYLFSLLEERGLSEKFRLVWLCTSDEEIGSPTGRHIVMEEAGKSEVVLVLEPSAEGGALKTARKGGGKFCLEVFGCSAHAGINPQDGANAIEELAYQIVQINRWADESLGTTINTGEIKGGTLFNVVPDYAMAEIDVRVLYPSEAKRLEQAFHSLQARNPRTRLKVEGSIYRPPMVRTEQTRKLFDLAQQQASRLGIRLSEVTTGGGSDGNFAAVTGVPVLDGLGVVGGYAHSPKEFLWKDSIPERTALLYGLINSL